MDTSLCVTPDMLKVDKYEVLGKLPNPFIFDNGDKVKTIDDWKKRREEIYKTAIELQYGTQPPKPEFLEVEQIYWGRDICGYKIHTGTRKNPVTFKMQIIIPQKVNGKIPFIVDGDMCWMYHMSKEYLNAALENGIGWVMFDRTELASDIYRDTRGHGVLYKTYPEYTFGALGAWAWGYSRCVDALEKLDYNVDYDYLTFCGHSRGGKTCALAGALDERAKIVNPNETCAGACSCYRIHMSGQYNDDPPFRSETLNDVLSNFGFWFGPEMEKYRHNEESLPFDAHYLKALIAPRTLFISEAAGDIWSNPIGSYQTTVAAREVYDFLDSKDNIYWYYRPGNHGHDINDVKMLVNLIKHKQANEKLSENMYKLPFKEYEKIFDWKNPNKE